MLREIISKLKRKKHQLLIKACQTGRYYGNKDGYHDVKESDNGEAKLLYDSYADVGAHCERIMRHFEKEDLKPKLLSQFHEGYSAGYNLGVTRHCLHFVAHASMPITPPVEECTCKGKDVVSLISHDKHTSLPEPPPIRVQTEPEIKSNKPIADTQIEYRYHPLDYQEQPQKQQHQPNIKADVETKFTLPLYVRDAVQFYNTAMHSHIGEQSDFRRYYTPTPFGIEPGEGSMRKLGDLSPFIRDEKGRGMLFFICAFVGDDNAYIFPAFGFDSKDERVLALGGFFDLFEAEEGYMKQEVRLVSPAVCKIVGNRIDLSQNPHSKNVKKGLIARV